jgi:tetratricopeptide (TPR) repeat protein
VPPWNHYGREQPLSFCETIQEIIVVAATESQRLAYRDKFRSLYNDAFQAWFEGLCRALHTGGDFQAVRKAQGDGGLDGFVINSQRVYQAYAPARIEELRDSEIARKINADFGQAKSTLGDQLKSWVFVHNHPEGKIGKLTAAALSEIKTRNPGGAICVLDIDSLWETLEKLPIDVLEKHFDATSTEELARVTEQIADVGDEIRTASARTEQAVHQLPREIELVVKSAVRSAMADSVPGAEHLKSLNQKRFDRAREELLNGSVVVAEKAYRELIADLESQGAIVDASLLFRSYTNLGSSLWQQFRRDEAVLWFDKAYNIKSDEPKAKTNKALCCIQKREFQAALSILEEARGTNPNNFDVLYLMSSIHVEHGDPAKAVKLLEDNPLGTEEYHVALGEAYLRLEKFSKVVDEARKALTKNQNSTGALIALANGLGFPLVRRRVRGVIGSFSLTEAERDHVIQAIQAGEAAAQIFRTEERYFQLGELLTNLSAFYELAGDDERAVLTAVQAAELTPCDSTTLTNLWASQMRLGKYADAYETAAKLKEHGGKLPGKIRQLQSLLENAQYERLLSECENEPDSITELHQDAKFFELKARAHFELHQVNEAFAVIDCGLSRCGDDASLYATRASFCEELGQAENATRDIDRAENATMGDKLRITFEAAMFFYRRNNWHFAAKRFEQLGSASIHSPFLSKYLICLFNLRDYTGCLQLAMKAIAARQEFDETLHDLAARCAYNSNDLTTAEKLLDKLVRRDTRKVFEHQKILAQVYLRLDEPAKAFAVLKKAHARKPKDVDVLIGLSAVTTTLKLHQEAVEYAFAAVKAAPKNAKAHMAVVKVCLDCPAEHKIKEKQRKGFQRSLEFLQKHPSGFIKAIPMEKDLKSFVAMVKARADHAQKVEDLVREKTLPMAFLAQQLGLSAFQAWGGLIGHPELSVHMAYGTTEEQAREGGVALSASAACVDVFALFTLRLVNRLSLLPKLFSKVLVHTSVLETIVGEIREMETKKTAVGITYNGGKLIRSETTTEQLEQRLAFLRDVRDFLKSPSVELVGVDTSAFPSGDLRKVMQAIGPVYYEPILAAKAYGAAYYCDDAPLRSHASQSYEVPGLSTQAFLRAAKEKRLLTDVEYEDCVITLLRHNYHFVSETADTIARLIETEHFQVSDLSKRMISRVADPKVDQSTSVRILSDVFLFLWRADYSAAAMTREGWMDLGLAALQETKQQENLFPPFVLNLAIRALTQPEAFSGITTWILRKKKFTEYGQLVVYLAVQRAILQMMALAEDEFPLWPELKAQWWEAGRLIMMLEKNGWI